MPDTSTLPPAVTFPGDEHAKQIGDGWERRNGSDLPAMPIVPEADVRMCNTNGWAGAGFRRAWRCTAHVHGWHRARLAPSGHVIAVWRDRTVKP